VHRQLFACLPVSHASYLPLMLYCLRVILQNNVRNERVVHCCIGVLQQLSVTHPSNHCRRGVVELLRRVARSELVCWWRLPVQALQSACSGSVAFRSVLQAFAQRDDVRTIGWEDACIVATVLQQSQRRRVLPRRSQRHWRVRVLFLQLHAVEAEPAQACWPRCGRWWVQDGRCGSYLPETHRKHSISTSMLPSAG